MRIAAFCKSTLVTIGFLASMVGLVVMPLTAQAQKRYVTVNGMILGPQELMIADSNAGFPLPNGHYWYDVESGYWGVAGGPPVGRVAPAPSQQGFSYRNDTTGTGMIYNPDGGSWQDRVWIAPD